MRRVLVAGDCVHTRLPHSFKKKTPAGQREEGADRAGPFFPAIDRTNSSIFAMHLLLPLFFLSLSLSSFLPSFLSLFFNRARTRSFLLGHIPSLSVCSVVCTLPPPRSSHVSVLPRNTSSCIFSLIYQVSERTKYSKTIVREFFETDCSLMKILLDTIYFYLLALP